MSRIVPTGMVMAAAVVLLADDGTGTGEPAPPSFAMTGAWRIGPYAAREFRRDDGALFVLQRIAGGGTPKRWLVVVWTSSPTRAAALTAFQALTDDLGANVIKAWRVVQNGGLLQIPTLDSDGTAVGTAVKNFWPVAWTADGAGAAPRFIGDVIA